MLGAPTKPTALPNVLINEITAALPASSPTFIDAVTPQTGSGSMEAAALASGLVAAQASVQPKYFYNALGSKLFEAITQLDEYYPTRTESAIFEANYSNIARAVKDAGVRDACLIDLGAGNCAKSAALIPHLAPSQYVPIDISVGFLREAAASVQASFPALDIVGVGMDFSSALDLPSAVQKHDRVFFYPGSSLGNFSPAQALAFLKQLTDSTHGNATGLLLGIDLVKDAATLQAAYDDALGVTGAFNKNALLNINDVLQSNFDVRQWTHVGLFNAQASRIEMHLQATCDLTVRWPGNERRFAKGERIHTESSYKYTPESITALLTSAGFKKVQHWTDANGWFAVLWASM
jgi:dimethylhistidine N-methyltransferase